MHRLSKNVTPTLQGLYTGLRGKVSFERGKLERANPCYWSDPGPAKLRLFSLK